MNWPASMKYAVSAGLTLASTRTSVRAQCELPEVTKLTAAGGEEGDRFGAAVSIDGDVIVVGAYWEPFGAFTGAAYVFERIDGAWFKAATLLAENGGPGDQFGSSVDVRGDVIAVGAWQADPAGDASGAAYVYERLNGESTQSATLVPEDAHEAQVFGTPVRVGDGVILVGAPNDDDNGMASGAVYVFERLDGVWTQSAKLTPTDAMPGDQFGGIAIDGGTAMISAGDDNDNGESAGSVHVFEWIAGVWTETDKPTPRDGAPQDSFGRVSLHGDVAVIGATGDDDAGDNAGSAYVFERLGDVWTETAKLVADNGVAGDHFGSSTATNGDIILVGSSDSDQYGNFSGAVHVFQRVGDTWQQTGQLAPDDLDGYDKFYQVWMEGSSAVVGALGAENDRGVAAGAAYVFEASCGCPADVNGDGLLNVLDFVAFQLAWQTSDPSADCNADDSFNVLDFVCFQQLFVNGCP